MLKLKLQYFGHLMQRADSLEKTLMLGKIEGRRRRGQDGWMASPTQWTWVWASSGRWTGKPGMLQSMGSQSQICLSAWKITTRVSDFTILGLFLLFVTMRILVQIISNSYDSLILPSHTSGSVNLALLILWARWCFVLLRRGDWPEHWRMFRGSLGLYYHAAPPPNLGEL